MLLFISNDYAVLENGKMMKGWQKKFSPKEKPRGLQFPSVDRQNLMLQGCTHQVIKAELLGIRASSSRGIRRWPLYGSILGCKQQCQRAEQDIWCIPKWKDRSIFCTSQVHLVNSWDVQIIINKCRDVLRILILILFKHGICVLAYFPRILSSS